jgi:hypothetical protein
VRFRGFCLAGGAIAGQYFRRQKAKFASSSNIFCVFKGLMEK